MDRFHLMGVTRDIQGHIGPKRGDFPIIHLGDPPPSKSDKTLYTGIYLPTFREGTNFIIKLLVSCLGALTGPRESPPWYL